MEIGKACCSLVLAYQETREIAGKMCKLKLTPFRLLWHRLLWCKMWF